MNDKLNDNIASKESLATIIGVEGFDKLSEQNQQMVISGITDRKDMDGGLMGKLFGMKPTNAAMNIATFICIFLLIIGMFLNQSQFWDKTIPIVAATVGYLFGKGRNQ